VIEEINTQVPKLVTTKIDLNNVSAKVGDQGVLQAFYDSSENNRSWYQCADIKVVAEGKDSAAAVTVVGDTVFYMTLAALLVLGVIFN
jgi:hypothetical protein